MGRRPLNTTKSGKFMNPTDQARKLARKKELKKNKKQRQLIRLAVLKSKDPKQILYEMEALDEMEFNTDKIPIFREAVLQDKRKKLREMLERVLGLYEKEEPEYFQEIKKLKREYEVRRVEKITYYESVKNAKNVNVDSIPLPENAGNLFSHDPNTDLSNMYYSFTNHHNMMLGSGASYYDQPPTLYNIPLPHTANSAAYDSLGYDGGQSTYQQQEQSAALLAMGADGSGDVQQPLLKSILKPSIGNVFGHRAGPPGPPMDPAPPLSPIRTEERDQAERRLSRDLRESKRSKRRSASPPSSSRRRRSRSRSGERSRSRERGDRERRRRRRDRESASPDRRRRSSSSESSASKDSEKSGPKARKQGSDTEEEFEEIIAEDKSYDEQANTDHKSRRIRFDGPEEDSYEEKDSRSKYKQLAKEIQSSRKQSRFNEERDEMRETRFEDAFAYGQSEIDELQHNNLVANYGDESDFYDAQQSMNYAMMQNSMMMKGFPMLPMQQTPYRPPINEPLLAPPPPPLFMQHKGQNSALNAPLRGYGFEEPNVGLPQIVGLPKLSYDRSVSNQPQYQQAQPYFAGGSKGTNAVIEAKPQIRSLTEESIKFMPTSLRVKRDAKAKKPLANKVTPSNYNKQGESGLYSQQKTTSNMTAAMMSSQTKDDAYAAFMKEMEEIM